MKCNDHQWQHIGTEAYIASTCLLARPAIMWEGVAVLSRCTPYFFNVVFSFVVVVVRIRALKSHDCKLLLRWHTLGRIRK